MCLDSKLAAKVVAATATAAGGMLAAPTSSARWGSPPPRMGYTQSLCGGADPHERGARPGGTSCGNTHT